MGERSQGSEADRNRVKKEQAEAEGTPIKSHECPRTGTPFLLRAFSALSIRVPIKKNGGEADGKTKHGPGV